MKISLFVISLLTILIPFKSTSDTVAVVKIIESSKPLDTSQFLLKDGVTELVSTADFVFYVEVTSKKVKGKKELSNHKKIKRKGQQYTITYIYEYQLSDIKRTYELYYIVWDDGEIFEVKPTNFIQVENIRLQTKIQ